MTLKEYRCHELLTGREVALIAGIAPATYSQLETGRRKVTVNMAEKLAPVFGVDAMDFFKEQRQIWKQTVLEKEGA